MQNRIGFYCWSGPDTIRMIQLKYFNPPLNTTSILSSYTKEYLIQLKKLLGITDFWVTFSWGFGIDNEKEQYKYITDKIKLFHSLNIRVHAYIQGPNRVYNDYHRNLDIWCRNSLGKKIIYHSKRYVTCLNNPNFIALQEQIVDEALKYDFDGIFIDNIWMGQIPLIIGNDMSFFGCKCNYCKALYFHESGWKIKNYYREYKYNKNFFSYQKFRINTVTNYLTAISNQVHRFEKEFGWNSYDGVNTTLTSGLDLKAVENICDYFLIENHSLPGIRYKKVYSNKYLEPFINTVKKPVFVVSYKEGIGLEPNYSREDFERMIIESNLLHYSPCFKGSEFYTNGEWHNLTLPKSKFLIKSNRTNEIDSFHKNVIFSTTANIETSVFSFAHGMKLRPKLRLFFTIPAGYIKLQGVNLGYHGALVGLANSKKIRRYFEKKGYYRKIYTKNGV